MSAQTKYLNKSYKDMTDAELEAAHLYWAVYVEEAAGWSSAYYAAKQLAHVCSEGQARGLKMTNPHQIRYG